MPALGIPGASNWKPEYAEYLEGLEVFAWKEEDKGGTTFIKSIAESIPNLRVIVAPTGIKDVSEAHIQGLDVPALLEGLIENAPLFSEMNKRFKVFTGDDALLPQPEIKWVVENIFQAPSVSLLVGTGGAKKTYSMLDCAVAVASGEQWLGFKTSSCPVLFVDEESGTLRLKRRLGDVLRGHESSSGAGISCVSLSGLALLQAEEQDALLELVQETGAGLVVIDALVDVLIGGDENSAVDMQAVFSALRRISEETLSAIVVIHHENRGGTYRGSSAMQGAVDMLLTIDAKKDSDKIDFAVDKARDIKHLSFGALSNFGEGTFNLSPSTPTEKGVHYSKSEAYVLRFLTAHGESPLEEIKANADTCSSEAAKAAVYSLVDKERVIRTNAGAKGAEAVYALVTQK